MSKIDILADTVSSGAHFYMAHKYGPEVPSGVTTEAGDSIGVVSHVADGCLGCAAEAALDSLAAIAKDARMKERALTDYFADASRRADEWQERAEQAERERDELQDWALDDLASATRQEG